MNEAIEGNKSRLARALVILIALIGIFVSSVTVTTHIEIAIDPNYKSAFCNISSTLNCAPVIGSPYSMFLGVPWGVYGIFFYSIVILISLLQLTFLRSEVYQSILTLLSLAAVVLSIILFFITVAVIKAICPLCLVLYLVNIAILYLVFFLQNTRSFFNSIVYSLSETNKFFKSLFGFGTSDFSFLQALLLIVLAVITAGSIFIYKDYLFNKTINSMFTPEKVSEITEQAFKEWESIPVVQIDIDRSNVLSSDFTQGDPESPIKIVEFSDYQCPACRSLHIELKSIKADYPDSFEFILKNFPIDKSCNSLIQHEAHQNACFAAHLSRCAGEQGRFWEMSDALFELPELEAAEIEIGRSAAYEVATQLGLDVNSLKECVDSKRHQIKIQKDIELADKLQLQGTPAVWINGKVLNNPHPLIIRKILSKLTSKAN